MTWTPRTRLTRDYAWVKAKQLGQFTYKQLSAAVGIDVKYAGELARSWETAGYVERVDFRRGAKVTMRVRPGREETPPELDANRRPIRPGTPRGNMWRAMRMVKVFSHRDIAMQANTQAVSVSEDEAREYCQALYAAGYFRVERKAGRHRPAVYRLVRDTGPVPPSQKRIRAVWDENLGEYTHLARAPQ